MFLALAPIIIHAFLLTVSSFNTGVPQALSWITLIMVASCAILAYRQSMAIVNPIANLVRAMQRLEEGEITARSTAKTVGELGTLQSRFNKMCAALHETHTNSAIGQVAREFWGKEGRMLSKVT